MEQLAFGAAAMVVGYLLLNKSMKKYIDEDSTCYMAFDTEKDAHIVLWQKIGAVIIVGMLPAFLGIVVLTLE